MYSGRKKSAHNAEITGLNLTIGTGREKMAKKSCDFLQGNPLK
jgi:hypothetical protein